MTTETKVTIKPLADRVVIRPAQREEVTASGVILPDTATEKPQRGTVLAVGPGKMLKDGSRRALQVKKGDKVLFTSWAGDEFKGRSTSDNILLMREEDVLAVIE